MAQKRMFNMKIVDSDAFLDMPLSAQCLYFHLNMRADDDGFVGNPKRITRLINANDDDLKLLLMKKFILAFDSGVIVIKHWRMHNTLSSRAYTETAYLEEKSSLLLKKNKSYSLSEGAPIDDSALIESQSKTDPESECIKNAFLMQGDKIREEENRDISISDEIDCCTDVQRVVNAWNAIDGLPKIIKLEPESKRGQMLGARIKQYGVDQVIRAIESVPNSSFLMGKTKKQFKLTFDWLVKPNNFPKVLEGNYLDDNKTVYAPDSEPYRGAKYLAKLLRKRMPTLPEYSEETLQKWAAALDELHGEGHEWDEISDVMNLSQNSDFWKRQICDAYALKRKYVNLLADLQRG